MLNYNEYINQINEGLITTHNILKYSTNLTMELSSIGIKSKINIINKFVYDIFVYNVDILKNKKVFDLFFTFNNNLGYFPSFYTLLLTNNNFKGIFNYDSIYNIIDSNNNFIYLKLRFESKFEDSLYKNNLTVPKICYHLSPTIYDSKIMYNGLIPKSKERKAHHPERIYLFYNINDAQSLLNVLKLNDSNNNLDRKYTLFEINLDKHTIIHSDSNYINGFFTYDIILPRYITILQRNL